MAQLLRYEGNRKGLRGTCLVLFMAVFLCLNLSRPRSQDRQGKGMDSGCKPADQPAQPVFHPP